MKKLTGKTFMLLLALSMTACILAYGCIWLLLPYAGRSQAERTLEEKAHRLAEKLRESEKAESGRLFLDFIRETGAYTYLLDAQGEPVSLFTFQRTEEEGAREGRRSYRYPFKFAGEDTGEEYVLLVQYNESRSEETAGAVRKSVPYAGVFLTGLSFVCAWIFSRYTTAPIVRINKIAGKLAQLDFSWYCPDIRDDEIGMLSKNINDLSDKLHAALEELHQRNEGLQDEIKLEKERERRQLLFFSGVSHELKTPVAIVIGQLEGMQAGIGVYKDREKYLARSVEILQSLNQFIKEILFVSHMDIAGSGESGMVSLSNLAEELLGEYAGYAEFYSVRINGEIEDKIYVPGQRELLKKALGGVIGNAVAYSPEGGCVTVELRGLEGGAEFTVINTPAHIPQEHLPHIFEAFYRGDSSRGNGSGLGLYITGMILDTYDVSYSMENSGGGVKFSAVF